MVGESIEGMKKRELLRSLIDANKVGDLMRKKFETVDPETALSDVVSKMKSSDLHEIPVVDGKKLLFDSAEALFTKLESMNPPIKAIREKIAGMMVENEIHEDVKRFFTKLREAANA